MNIEVIRSAINKIVDGKNTLRKLGVIRSERLIGEIGEWIGKSIFGGESAESSSQKGYDLVIDGKKYQVKAHAKGENNNARWTEFKYEKGQFDYLVIIVMCSDLYLKEVYCIDEETVFSRLNLSKKQRVVDWDNYTDYKIPLAKLPNQDLVKLFTKNA
jgi:hypothetical protein